MKTDNFQLLQTIGFGDIKRPSKRARIFLWGYIIVCAGLVAYLFSNLNIVKNGLKLLSDKEKRAHKLLDLEFVLHLDSTGEGVTQAEFILAVLEHEGIISKDINIAPWAEVTACFFFSTCTTNLVFISTLSMYRNFASWIK